jgi:hypothetical protein
MPSVCELRPITAKCSMSVRCAVLTFFFCSNRAWYYIVRLQGVSAIPQESNHGFR